MKFYIFYYLMELYHITSIDNDESIRKYGIIPKSETKDLSYPDRVYLFTEYDKHAMVNHMRASGKLNTNISGWPAIIYKIKPNNNIFFVDTRALDYNGNLIETCVYTYDPISPECIIDTEIINIKGQNI